MVKVVVSNNTKRDTIVVNEKSATPKACLTDLKPTGMTIDFGGATINLDGVVLDTKAMNKTLEELGIQADDTCYLGAITKTSNAA